MLKIFAMNNTVFNDGEKFARALAGADGYRRRSAETLVPREKKNAALAAGLILPLALKACGAVGEVTVEREWGAKPRLVSPAGWYFNLSHSGEWTCLALSDGEVGIDIQQERPVDMRLATRFFTAEEQAALQGAGERAEELFYRLWTVKEAYLKALGTGLNRPLNSFSVRFGAGGAKISDPEREGEWRVSELSDFGGYKIAVCAAEYVPDEPVSVIEY